MSASALEARFTKAVQDGDFPGVVLVAKSADGSVNYTKAIGRRTLLDGNKDPMEPSTPMQLASLSKLLTTVVALQQVERGTLSLTQSVLGHLPELAALPVLAGFAADGAPQLEPRRGDITLTHLLTHSAGCAYAPMDEKLVRYFAWRREPPANNPTVAARLSRCPLIYQPGEGWAYGTSLDWTGLLLERVCGADLDTLFRRGLVAPLALPAGELTFWPQRNTPGYAARRAGMAMRDARAADVRHTAKDAINDGSQAAFGGHGSFGSIPAYGAVLASLVDPADTRLLRADTKAAMFRPHLSPAAEQALNDVLLAAAAAAHAGGSGQSAFVGELPADRVRYSWGLGGILSLAALDGWRGSHSLLWSGLPNHLWIMDPERGVSLLFGTQVMPPGDLRVADHIRAFEDFVYAQLRERRAEKL